jgi:hypothetical protein
MDIRLGGKAGGKGKGKGKGERGQADFGMGGYSNGRGRMDDPRYEEGPTLIVSALLMLAT